MKNRLGKILFFIYVFVFGSIVQSSFGQEAESLFLPPEEEEAALQKTNFEGGTPYTEFKTSELEGRLFKKITSLWEENHPQPPTHLDVLKEWNDPLRTFAVNLMSYQPTTAVGIDGVIVPSLFLDEKQGLASLSDKERKALAFKLFDFLAEFGDVKSSFYVGEIFKEGKIAEKDLTKASYYFGRAEWIAYQPKEPDYIRFDKGVCEGSCPIYSIYIYKSGLVEYLGKRFVPVHGVVKGTTENNLMGKLVERINLHIEKGMPLRDPKNCESVLDVDSAQIVIAKKSEKNPKTLYHFYGCYGAKGVKELARLFHDVRQVLPFKELGLHNYKVFELRPFKFPVHQ